MGGTYRQCGLLYDNLGTIGNLCDISGSQFPVLEIRSTASTNTLGFGRGVDGYKDDLALSDSFINLG